jgi:hypothetical protein
MAIGANSSLVIVEKRGWQVTGPWKLLLRGPPNQIKRSPQPLDSCMYAQSSCKMSAFHGLGNREVEISLTLENNLVSSAE